MKQDRDYLKSGNWKCEKSPTGAHRWIEVLDEETRPIPEFKCKWCRVVRRFPTHDGKRSYKV